MKRILTTMALSMIAFVIFIPVHVLAATSFEGKIITIIEPHKAGGGYDRMSRLLAAHLPKHIPGKPTMVVQNMTGGKYLVATNYVYNQAKPDGLTIGSYNRSTIVTQWVGAKGVKFDMTKMSWLGSASSEPSTLLIRNDLPYKTFEDLVKAKKTIYFGCSSPGAYTRVIPLVLRDYGNLKNMEMVTYRSARDYTLAVERKEIDAFCGTYSSNLPDIKRGLLRPLARSRYAGKEIEHLPVYSDLVKDKRARSILDVYSYCEQVGRPYAGPPGIPDNILKILRKAFLDVANDPELQADARKVMMPVDPLPADNVQKIYEEILNFPEETKKEFLKYYNM